MIVEEERKFNRRSRYIVQQPFQRSSKCSLIQSHRIRVSSYLSPTRKQNWPTLCTPDFPLPTFPHLPAPAIFLNSQSPPLHTRANSMPAFSILNSINALTRESWGTAHAGTAHHNLHIVLRAFDLNQSSSAMMGIFPEILLRTLKVYDHEHDLS